MWENHNVLSVHVRDWFLRTQYQICCKMGKHKCIHKSLWLHTHRQHINRLPWLSCFPRWPERWYLPKRDIRRHRDCARWLCHLKTTKSAPMLSYIYYLYLSTFNFSTDTGLVKCGLCEINLHGFVGSSLSSSSFSSSVGSSSRGSRFFLAISPIA